MARPYALGSGPRAAEAHRVAAAVISMTWPQYRRRFCSVDGRSVRLSKQRAEILSTLLMRYPDTVTDNEMIEVLWPHPDDQPETASSCIKVSIARLRDSIGEDYIETVWGRGYRLVQEGFAAAPVLYKVPPPARYKPLCRPPAAPTTIAAMWHEWGQKKAAAALIVAEMRAAADALESSFGLGAASRNLPHCR